MFQTTNQAFSDVLSLSTATVKFLVGLRQHFLSLRWLAPCESRRVHQLRASCGCGLPHLDSSSASRTRTPSSPLSPTLPSLLLQLVSFHWVDTLTEEALLVRHGAMDDGFADVSRAHSDRFGAYCRWAAFWDFWPVLLNFLWPLRVHLSRVDTTYMAFVYEGYLLICLQTTLKSMHNTCGWSINVVNFTPALHAYLLSVMTDGFWIFSKFSDKTQMWIYQN